MPLIDYIAAAVFLISLVGIIIIIAKKFPTLAAIDAGASPDPSTRKTSLLEQRLKRKFTGLWSRVSNTSQPLLKNMSGAGQRLQRKLVDMEHEYKVRSLPVFLNKRQQKKVAGEINDLLEQAQVFFDDGEFHAAEEKALQVVRLEPRSVPAFTLLGELYLTMKEYQHAKEVYRYLLKLNTESDAIFNHADPGQTGAAAVTGGQSKQNVNYYLELAQVERRLGEWDEAFGSIQEAVRLEPNHPKVLDELIEISLGYGKKQFAEDALGKIKASNPDNKKIPDWEERLSQLA